MFVKSRLISLASLDFFLIFANEKKKKQNNKLWKGY